MAGCMNMPSKILVIKFRHIGDVLLTAPLISTLKHGIPGVHVACVVKPGTDAMLEGHPDLDELFAIPMRLQDESWSSFFMRTFIFLRKMRKSKFDLVINTTEGDRGVILAWLSGARDRWGIVKKGREQKWQARLLTRQFYPLQGYAHTVIRNLFFASPFGLRECREVRLQISSTDERELIRKLSAEGVPDTRKNGLVHCHPTSRWMFKCWPADKFSVAIDWLQEHGCTVVLTCAPNVEEMDFLQLIIERCKSKPIDLGGRLTLRQTAALSKISRFFFGVDSAPMHMSAAVDTPTLGIFGPSGTFDWGPWPNNWKGKGTPYPGWNGVKYAGDHVVVQDGRSCVPCGKAGCYGTKHSDCLEELGTDKVIVELEKMLGKY